MRLLNILVDKAFASDWFNKTYDHNLPKEQLARLLEIVTTNQFFQFDGQLYEQVDGVTMGLPFGPLMANVFMCHLEDKVTHDEFDAYTDDTLARMPSTDAAVDFLTTLNSLHPSLSFTMDLPVDNKIPFIGMEIIKNRTKTVTQVYRKHWLAVAFPKPHRQMLQRLLTQNNDSLCIRPILCN